MATCKDCICYESCLDFAEMIGKNIVESITDGHYRCEFYKDRSRFVKLKSAVWCKHKPELSKMEKFHKQGIGLGMSENSVFWTCSNCGVWGSPIYSFCPHCGARITKEREENA